MNCVCDNYRHTKGLTAGLTDVEHSKYYFYTQLRTTGFATKQIHCRPDGRHVQYRKYVLYSLYYRMGQNWGIQIEVKGLRILY